MEGENKKAIKYLTNPPAIVHNYGKLNKSESPRTHSSPTSILRKFPHSLRHDQKHQTKIKRDSFPVNVFHSGKERKATRHVKSWCAGDKESEEFPSSDESGKCWDDGDLRKKRKFSEGSTSSDCSGESEVWKLRSTLVNMSKEKSVLENQEDIGSRPKDSKKVDEQNQTIEETVGCIKKLSVINKSWEECKYPEDERRGSREIQGPELGRRLHFPVHKSTPNLLRNETFGFSCSISHSGNVTDRSSSGAPFLCKKVADKCELFRNERHLPLKASDSLPHLNNNSQIFRSFLPKINRTISESHKSSFGLKKSSSLCVKFGSQGRYFEEDKMFEIGAKSDDSHSGDENEVLSLIDSRRNVVIQSTKDRKEGKNRRSYKKAMDLMPSLRSLMSRKSRGGGDVEETMPQGASAPLKAPRSPKFTSCLSLNAPQIRYFDEDDEDMSERNFETVYTLTNSVRADSMLQIEPIKPINRLRVPPNGFYGSTSRMCSRCSSLLSMASSSRYSINTTGSGFVNCSPTSEKPPEPIILCKLCLMEVPVSLSMEINRCGCVFCKDCMRLYVEFEIQEGAYDISCPDAQCVKQGVVTIGEVETLVMPHMMERYLRFRLNHEVDMDRNRTWCPRAGCETVCNICPREKCAPTSVHCPTCDSDFCSNCKNTWHKGLTCEENSKKLAKEGRSDFMEPGIPFDSDSIKSCPMCNVPIEKDEGCAQMMCKRCKHVFCWYCLASLDDDFLLRHYDKGPCKNKLGHSRASVIWHRTQVIGIFAGLGLLLLVASPLLLLAAPCIVCCKCRVCSGTKLDAEDDLPEESGT